MRSYTVFKDTDKEFSGCIADICRHFNKNRNLLRKLMNHGSTIEQAILYDPESDTEVYNIIDEKGQPFSGTVLEISRYLGYKNSTYLYRVYINGMSPQEAVHCKGYNKNYDKTGQYKGSLREICRKNGLSLSKVSYAMKNGDTLDETINKEYGYTVFNGTPIEFSGNLIQVCEKFGIERHIAYYYMKRYGMTLEQVIIRKKPTVLEECKKEGYKCNKT